MKTSSVTKSQVLHGEHAWNLDGYNDILQSVKGDQDVSSDDFNIWRETAIGRERLRFRIGMRMKSKVEETSSYLGVHLYWLSSSIRQPRYKLKVKFRFAILNKNGDNFLWTDNGSWSERYTTFTNTDSKWGYPKGFRKSQIASNSQDVLIQDSLKLKCYFKILCDYPQDSSQAKLCIDNQFKDGKETLSNSFANLLESGELSDVQIVCQGTTFKCHKLVLATRSEVFKAMFAHKNMKEGQPSTLRIVDSTSDSVSQMINFIYTDNCEDLVQHVWELLPLADKYDLGKLKQMCVKWLAENISVANAAKVIILADLHCCENLFKIAKNFVLLNMDSIKHTEGWELIKDKHSGIMAKLLETLPLSHKSQPEDYCRLMRKRKKPFVEQEDNRKMGQKMDAFLADLADVDSDEFDHLG